MTKVCVTGGSGGAGNAIIRDLLAKGYDCLNLDINPPNEELCPFAQLDMTDYDAVLEAMTGSDMLVHMAGNPHPDEDHRGAADRFANNTVALFNAFNAAAALGIKRIVWASSETIFGFPFIENQPPEVPLTETATPAPQTGYAVSKAASETIAELMAEMHGMTIIGLRLSNVLYDDVAAVPSFQKIPGYWDDLNSRKFNLWGYIDCRDAARAVRLALEADLSGAEVFNIAAVDTIMKQPSRELVEQTMPEVKIHHGLTGRHAMLDCNKARILLGWEPEYTWSSILEIDPSATNKDDAS
ncbi:NAD(P)-dependent oxidoreductase [Ruegeria sp. SCPT10]|uniref:NAD-dependent epimerase/dehydratase family protein n=1 Tax=Ruegeria sp. SCP10 TaxID=3141377 RepID=UPI00333BD24E